MSGFRRKRRAARKLARWRERKFRVASALIARMLAAAKKRAQAKGILMEMVAAIAQGVAGGKRCTVDGWALANLLREAGESMGAFRDALACRGVSLYEDAMRLGMFTAVGPAPEGPKWRPVFTSGGPIPGVPPELCQNVSWVLS